MGITAAGSVRFGNLAIRTLMKNGFFAGLLSQALGDAGDKFIKGDDISYGQIAVNSIWAGIISAAFTGIVYGASRAFRTLWQRFRGVGGAVEGGTDVNPQSPMFGEDWHRYFNETYGQENVTWESASIQDIIDMPSKITDFSPNQIANLAKANGWSVSPLGKGGLAGVPYEQGGGFSMHAPNGGSEYIQYHPGGGHHGKSPYFKISSGPNGIVRYFIGGNGQ